MAVLSVRPFVYQSVILFYVFLKRGLNANINLYNATKLTLLDSLLKKGTTRDIQIARTG